LPPPVIRFGVAPWTDLFLVLCVAAKDSHTLPASRATDSLSFVHLFALMYFSFLLEKQKKIVLVVC
jgi:hypothetical protein